MSNVAKQKRRNFWLKQLHQWHWVSAAICLVAMLMFSVTGITLNHSSRISAEPAVTSHDAQLPPPLLSRLVQDPASDKAALPAALEDWIGQQLDVRITGHSAEWSDNEVYLSLPRPGGDAWLSINRKSGQAHYERTDRGWIAYLNDLHKGRNTGTLWSWFIDAFAVACVLFAGTGLFLLKMNSSRRPGTWPLVALGFALPLVLLIVFVH